jgi:hypothetical protein
MITCHNSVAKDAICADGAARKMSAYKPTELSVAHEGAALWNRIRWEPARLWRYAALVGLRLKYPHARQCCFDRLIHFLKAVREVLNPGTGKLTTPYQRKE